MQELGQYVIMLTTAALICGIFLSLFPEGMMRTILKLVCGVFLMVTALSAMTGFSLPNWEDLLQYSEPGNVAGAMGEEMAKEERMMLIKTGLEAYILDKAAVMEYDIKPDIQLNQDGIPVFIQITGEISNEAQQALATIITNDLGIPEENQQWIGEK